MIPYIQKPNKVIVKLYNTDNSFIESIIIPTERYPVDTNFQCFDYSNTEKINDKHILDIFDSIDFLSEPSLQVTLYQGVPKSDKMDWIIQKTVELGIARIVPVQTARSIARADGDRSTKKQERWQRIAAEAAGQSGRGKIPAVSAPLSWVQMLAELEPAHTLVFYEGGGQPLTTLVSRDSARLNMIVGPEGGFAPEEIEELVTRGVIPATLGKRILRCETAPVAALAAVMCLSGNME